MASEKFESYSTFSAKTHSPITKKSKTWKDWLPPALQCSCCESDEEKVPDLELALVKKAGESNVTTKKVLSRAPTSDDERCDVTPRKRSPILARSETKTDESRKSEVLDLSQSSRLARHRRQLYKQERKMMKRMSLEQQIANTRPSRGSERKSLDETARLVGGAGNEDDPNDANSTPPFVREGLRTSIASAASGESFSSVSGTETQDDAESGIVKHRSTSLSALGTRSDSLASVYSAAGEARYGTVTVKGEVQFALFYNYRHSELQVLVKQCRDLAPVDVKRSRSDPYVKVYLLPDRSKSGKRKTKVKKHTLSPVFDENLKFPTTLNELDTRTLWLTVWHSDMFGRNDFLGEVLLPLAGKIFDDITPRWYPLQERTEPLEDSLVAPLSYGDLVVALKYLPPEALASKKGRKSKGALHILVKEAKNLIPVRSNGLADPICKSCLIPEKYKQSKQKTSVCKRTLNPNWNHTFVYEGVSLEELKERCIEITIWDHDRLGSKDFMGGVRFNSGLGEHQGKAVDWADARGNELTLWQNMLERPNLWFEGLVPLRTFKEKPQD